MKVFVAGASGAIGRPLVRQLVAAGHEVTGSTRSPERAREIDAAGAEGVVCDALDPEAVRSAVAGAGPEVVINQLTSLPARYQPNKASFYEQTNRLRGEGGHHLAEAAKAAGAKRFITQSISFLLAPEGPPVGDETGRPATDAPGHFGESARIMIGHEEEITGSDAFEGLVLRYGQFYGPGTYYAPDGYVAGEVRRRRLPVIGAGTGVFSFVHVEDAAGATVAALDRGSPGVYNVTDDEPAELREWLPEYARFIGARPPRKAPVWLVRLIAGRQVAESGVSMRGASNAKAKRDLGWELRYPSWRQGFPEAFD